MVARYVITAILVTYLGATLKETLMLWDDRIG